MRRARRPSAGAVERLEPSMDSNRSRFGMLIGLGAAAGAFGAAAMMAAATAPTARADEFTDVISAVEANYTAGAAALTTAGTDFSSAELAPGLASLINGLDDDSVLAPENFLIGTVEVLTNQPLDLLQGDYNYVVPSDFSIAVSNVETYFTFAAGEFSTAATALASGDYIDALIDDTNALDAIVVDPLQELLLGAAVSF
jgi:hypothetical protein